MTGKLVDFAYPGVANNCAEAVTQPPGISAEHVASRDLRKPLQDDITALKSFEDGVAGKKLKAVPNTVDVANFGGSTRDVN